MSYKKYTFVGQGIRALLYFLQVVPHLYHTMYHHIPSLATINLFHMKQNKGSKSLKFQAFSSGGAYGSRTHDLKIANQIPLADFSVSSPCVPHVVPQCLFILFLASSKDF